MGTLWPNPQMHLLNGVTGIIAGAIGEIGQIGRNGIIARESCYFMLTSYRHAHCGTVINSKRCPSGVLKYTPRPPPQSLNLQSVALHGALPNTSSASFTRLTIASNSASLTWKA